MSTTNDAQAWIETVTGLKFASTNFRASLRSGVLLCLLLNKLLPGSTKIKNPSKYPKELQDSVRGENISSYRQALLRSGFPEGKLFAVAQLLNKNDGEAAAADTAAVAAHIGFLARSRWNTSGVGIAGEAPPPRTVNAAAGAPNSNPAGPNSPRRSAAAAAASSNSSSSSSGGGTASTPPPQRHAQSVVQGQRGVNSEARIVIMRKLVPELIHQNAQLKAKLLEMAEQMEELSTQNKELQVRLEQLSSSAEVGDGIIMGNYYGHLMLKAGAPEKLIDVLSNPNFQGSVSNYTGVFLLTFRLWSDVPTVFHALVKKFKEVLAQRSDVGEESGGEDGMLRERIVQSLTRIAKFFRRWVDEAFDDFLANDSALLPELESFVQDHIARFNADLARGITRAIEKQKADLATLSALESPRGRSDSTVSSSTDMVAVGVAQKDPSEVQIVKVAEAQELLERSKSKRMRSVKRRLLGGNSSSSSSRESTSGGGGGDATAAATAVGGITAEAAAADAGGVTGLAAAAALAPTSRGGGSFHVFATPAPEPLLPKGGANVKVSNVEDVTTLELARQLTLIDFELFRQLKPREFLGNAFSGKRRAELAPNVGLLTEQFNDISSWVMYNVCTVVELKKRGHLIKKFVQLAHDLCKLHNFHGMFAVVAGLSGASVSRLKKSWEIVHKDKKINEMWDRLIETTNPQSSFAKYRQLKSASKPPGIPYIGVSMTDLTFIEEGNKDKLENGFVNVLKYYMISDIVGEIRHFQQTPYNLVAVPNVIEYLQSSRSIDEEKLYALSLTIEPREKK